MDWLKLLKRLILPGPAAAVEQGPSSEDWQWLRAPPAESDQVLTTDTHLWLRGIPRALHPKHLCRYHPRAANRLARCWHDPDRAHALLHELLTDLRGGRTGFPARVTDELLLLRYLVDQPGDAQRFATRVVVLARRRDAAAASRVAEANAQNG